MCVWGGVVPYSTGTSTAALRYACLPLTRTIREGGRGGDICRVLVTGGGGGGGRKDKVENSRLQLGRYAARFSNTFCSTVISDSHSPKVFFRRSENAFGHAISFLQLALFR